jgi:hypothetical protein
MSHGKSRRPFRAFVLLFPARDSLCCPVTTSRIGIGVELFNSLFNPSAVPIAIPRENTIGRIAIDAKKKPAATLGVAAGKLVRRRCAEA